MPKRNYLLTLITAVMILSFTFTSAGALPPAGEGIGTDIVWTDPEPYYPVEETIFDKTPEFRFSQYNGVTKYRIKVRNYEDQSIEYYTYKGTATCDSECRMTPDIPLAGGVITYGTESKGYYEWTVEAKLAPGVWSGIQAYVPFGLGTTGFNSQFTSDKKNWQDINGAWTLTPAGYLKNTGIPAEYTSTLYKKRIYDNFTYTVRMKLKTATDYAPSDPNRHFGGIVIDGNDGPNTDPSHPSELKVWSTGVNILYRNNKDVAVFLYKYGALLPSSKGWMPCSAVITDGWNTIKAVVTGQQLEVYINKTLCKTVTDPLLEDAGYVGFVNRRYSTQNETMLVDWAKLEVDTP